MSNFRVGQHIAWGWKTVTAFVNDRKAEALKNSFDRRLASGEFLAAAAARDRLLLTRPTDLLVLPPGRCTF
jgi:hypothetical protein